MRLLDSATCVLVFLPASAESLGVWVCEHGALLKCAGCRIQANWHGWMKGAAQGAVLQPALRQCHLQEQQLREAHLDEDINWDKLTAAVMQQMEQQHM